MDLVALRCFRAVARREHISRAAEDLRVAQPSVSRTIARLEAELGVPLFERRGRRVRLNPTAPPSCAGWNAPSANSTTRGGSWPTPPGGTRAASRSPPRPC
ncbi:LysR family transcriptional regulator [Streptomyces sp. M19]